MSVLKKIMTAVRGGAREVGELIVDANGTRIFEQEIKDATGPFAESQTGSNGCDGETDAGWPKGRIPESRDQRARRFMLARL